MRGRNLGKDPGKRVTGVEERDRERYINCRDLGKYLQEGDIRERDGIDC